MSQVRATVAALTFALVVAGCGSGGDDSAKLADQLKEPLSRSYGPVDSMRCEKNDEVKLLGGRTAYDCTLELASGRVERLCGGFANGVPLVAAHVPCGRLGHT
jgi:hypothetical protein